MIKLIVLKLKKTIFYLLIYFNVFKNNFSKKITIKNKYFIQKLRYCKFYLEYGSGESTLLAVRFKKKFYSIESDKTYYNYLKNKIPKKSGKVYKLINFSPTYQFSVPIFFFIRKYFLKKKAKLYAQSPLDYLLKNKIIPELIFIDGRYRVLCCLMLYKYLKYLPSICLSKITILIDDYPMRNHYFILKKFFFIKNIENMALLKIKKLLISKKNFDKLIDKYCLDFR